LLYCTHRVFIAPGLNKTVAQKIGEGSQLQCAGKSIELEIILCIRLSTLVKTIQKHYARPCD